jgi:hypothetical protein
MTYLEAAIAILKGSKRRMTAKEIVQEATARGLLQPFGKTPEATLSARLYCYVRDTEDPAIERFAKQGVKGTKRGSVMWGLSDRISG